MPTAFSSAEISNLDGVVNTADFTRLATRFNASTQLWSDGDFNYDGRVNSLDFNALASNFGQALSSQTLASLVPEPAIAVATLFPLAMWLRRSRKSRICHQSTSCLNRNRQ